MIKEMFQPQAFINRENIYTLKKWCYIFNELLKYQLFLSLQFYQSTFIEIYTAKFFLHF